jgi:hypothetical protein
MTLTLFLPATEEDCERGRTHLIQKCDPIKKEEMRMIQKKFV